MTTTAGQGLEVQLLGPVRAWYDEVEVELGAGLRRAVFAVLAMRAGSAVSKSELVDAVWGETAPRRVEGSLYSYISGLRRGLEPQCDGRTGHAVIGSARSGYTLRMAADAVDAVRFNRLREEAERHFGDRDLPAALAAFDAALKLWRGVPMQGLSGPFVELQRKKLAEDWLVVAEGRAAVAMELGRHAQIISELTELAGAHPTRESLRCLLMTALYRSGRTADALDAFQVIRRTLINEFGIGPGPELRALHDRILADDPSLRPAAVEGASPRVAPVDRRDLRSVTPLIGRDEEMTVLTKKLGHLDGGRGGALWIEGEAGVGKSVLVSNAIAGVVDADVVWCAADEFSAVESLRTLAEAVVGGRSVARHDEPVEAADESGDALCAKVDWVLEKIRVRCAERPVVLVVENAQLCDHKSLVAMNRLVKSVARLPLLVILVVRCGRRRADLQRLRDSVVAVGEDLIHIEPLTADDAHQLVESAVGARAVGELAEAVERMAGNPRYLTTALNGLAERGQLEYSGDLVDIDAGHVEDLPGVAAASEAALRCLSESARDVLRWAAVLGVEFRLSDLAVVTGKPAIDLVAAVDEATNCDLLIEGDECFRFRCPLLRSVIYWRIAMGLRGLLHRQAAELLAQAGAAVEDVAAHLVAGPDRFDAWAANWVVEHVDRIGVRAPGLGAELLRRALAYPSLPPQHREALAIRRSFLLFWRGQDPDSEIQAALALISDLDCQSEVRLFQAYVHFTRQRLDDAQAVLEDILSSGQGTRGCLERCEELLAFVRLTVQQEGHWAPAGEFSEGRLGLVHSVWQWETFHGRHARGLELLDREIRTAVGCGDGAAEAELLGLKAIALQNLNLLREAGECITEAKVKRGHLSDTRIVGTIALAEASQAFWTGDWDRSLSVLGQLSRADATALFRGVWQRRAVLQMHGLGAVMAAHRGRRAEVNYRIQVAGEVPWRSYEMREPGDLLLVSRALGAEARGRLERALYYLEIFLDRAVAPMAGQHHWFPLMMRLAVQAGRTDLVRALTEACSAEESLEDVPARAAVTASWCRALSTGDPDAMIEVVETLRAAGRTFEAATASEDCAALLVAKGRNTEALLHFQKALSQYRSVGAACAIERAERRLRVLRNRRRRTVLGLRTIVAGRDGRLGRWRRRPWPAALEHWSKG